MKDRSRWDHYATIITLVSSSISALFIGGLLAYTLGTGLGQIGSVPIYRQMVRTQRAIASSISLPQQTIQYPNKPLITNGEVSIELDVPDYLPQYLRYPQKVFSGRTVVVRTPEPCDEDMCFFSEEATGKKSNFKKPDETEFEGEEGKSFVFEIPFETKTGNYLFNYVSKGQRKSFRLEVHGFDEERELSYKSSLQQFEPQLISQPVNVNTQPENFIISRSTISSCYWEMSLAGSQTNPNILYHACANSPVFSRSTDGGATWNSTSIDSITTYPRSTISYFGDNKMAVSDNGQFYLTSLFKDSRTGPGTWQYGGMLYSGWPTGNVTNTFISDIVSSQGFAYDYPKLALGEPNVYIAAQGVKILPSWHPGLYSSSDNGNTYQLNDFYCGSTNPVRSLGIGTDGTVYGASYTLVKRVDSLNPFTCQALSIPTIASGQQPRVSTTSNRAWYAYTGQELVIDKSNGVHYGRLYLISAKETSIVYNPNVENGQYGYNFDIWASYSDDRGDHWSTPVKVNDDIGNGDQVFPSASVDTQGILHVAFLDHRNNQDQAIFDVYYANSADGGITFSQNIKVNDLSVPNLNGHREPGDYLDMVVGYPDQAKIAYPCVLASGGTMATNACLTTVAVLPTPSNLTFSATPTQVALSWKDTSINESGFKIERSDDQTIWSQVGVVGQDVTSFSDNSVTAGATYLYRVRAYSTTLGDSPNYSNTMSVTVPTVCLGGCGGIKKIPPIKKPPLTIN